MVTTWLWNTWNVASATDKLIFLFYLIWSHQNWNWNSHMWLVATLLDRAVQDNLPSQPHFTHRRGEYSEQTAILVGSLLCWALQYLRTSPQIPSYSSEYEARLYCFTRTLPPVHTNYFLPQQLGDNVPMESFDHMVPLPCEIEREKQRNRNSYRPCSCGKKCKGRKDGILEHRAKILEVFLLC